MQQQVFKDGELSKFMGQLTRDVERLGRNHRSVSAARKAVDRVAKDVESIKSLVELRAGAVDKVEVRVKIDRPVEYVRKFLGSHPKLSRAEALRRLEADGVNPATARTQYYHWKKSH